MINRGSAPIAARARWLARLPSVAGLTYWSFIELIRSAYFNSSLPCGKYAHKRTCKHEHGSCYLDSVHVCYIHLFFNKCMDISRGSGKSCLINRGSAPIAARARWLARLPSVAGLTYWSFIELIRSAYFNSSLPCGKYAHKRTRKHERGSCYLDSVHALAKHYNARERRKHRLQRIERGGG